MIGSRLAARTPETTGGPPGPSARPPGPTARPPRPAARSRGLGARWPRLAGWSRRLRPNSLRGRLSLLALLVTAVFLALLTAAFSLVLTHQLRAGADQLLKTRAEASSSTVDIATDGRLTLREPPEDRALDAGTWIYQGATALQRPTEARADQRAADALAGTGEHFAQTGDPGSARLFALPLRLAGRQIGTVVTVVELDPYDRVADLALAAATALAVLVLAGAFLLTRALVGRALAPVAQMTSQASQWGASDLGRRFGEGERPTELAALAATLDGQLERLAAVLRHEQQLSAELSHELRTPLSALIAELDLLRSRPRGAGELAAGHEAIAASAERMSRVLESLLTAARATSSALPGRCQVLAAVQAAVSSVAAPPGAVVVHDRSPGLAAGVDPALLERALAPVLDNALHHARDGVVVTVGSSARGPWVQVQDDGPGVAEELMQTLFEPGVRGADGHDGSGLGLALARRLARAGGGDLRLESGPGGARFVLALPAA